MVWLELFDPAFKDGNLNVTWVQPGAILGWHRHQHQDDYMVVLDGTLRVGQWREGASDLFWTTLSGHHPAELQIPRGWWHGYQNIGDREALVLTWITQPYNPKDEERLDPALASEHHGISWVRKPK